MTNIKTFFFSKNELTGTFPFWFKEYHKLEKLNLAFNRLEGTLPTFLGGFEELTAMALDNNRFTSVGMAFDTSITHGLRKLEHAFLENNQFDDALDENFMRELTALRYLDISDNKFPGSLPPHLFEMPHLEVLDLHDNNFTQLPLSFQVNDKLYFLALHKCNFANQIPSDLANLRNLEHLDLSQNAFTGEIPSSIRDLKNLTYLFLAQNEFTPGTIPQWIGGLSQLEEISLKTTQRTGLIPNFFVSLPNLVLLDLDSNQLTGTIPESFGNLSKLQVLLLNRNDLNSTIPASFAQLELRK